MFGKLLKHDFKSSARGVATVYFAAGIAAIATILSLFTGFGIGKVLACVALMITGWLAMIITVVHTFTDYKKSMFGDSGYLTNTFPVKSFSLVFSKWLTAVFWLVVSLIFIAITYALLYAYSSGENGFEALKMGLKMLPDILYSFGLPDLSVLKKAIPFYILKFLFFLAVSVCIAYFSVTISNVRPFDRFGSIGTIVTFFIIFAVVNLIGAKLDDLVSFAVIILPETRMELSVNREAILSANSMGGCYVSLTQIYFEAIAAILLFVANSELIEKKVNIK